MNVNKYNNQFVRNNLNETDILLQLAEEAGELAQAAAKKARIILGNNPTPVTSQQADLDLISEFADVLVCYSTLFAGYKDHQVMSEAKRKLARWVTRLGGTPEGASKLENKKKYYTKDSVLIEVGSTYFGENDGRIWVVTGFVPSNGSHTVQAKNVKLGIKELKPSWLTSKPITGKDMCDNLQKKLEDNTRKRKLEECKQHLNESHERLEQSKKFLKRQREKYDHLYYGTETTTPVPGHTLNESVKKDVPLPLVYKEN